VGFQKSFPTTASRNALARSFGNNVGLRALLGPPHSINTAAGFTEWRCLAILSVVGPIWALLTATRLLRGEEDAGRWELLLSGHTTRLRASIQAVAGLCIGVLAVATISALLTVVGAQAVGVAVGGAVFFAIASSLGAALFVAVGSLSSQLMDTRRSAAGLAGGIIGACFVLRMVGDSSTRLGWMLWLNPLGWIQELRPFTQPQLLPLIPLAVVFAACAAAALWLSNRRDAGAGILPSADARRPRTKLLNGPTGLTVRLLQPVALAWLGGCFAWSLLMGVVSNSGSTALNGSPVARQVMARLGALGPYGFLGVIFLLTAALLALTACGQAASMAEEETSGQLEVLMARRVSRAAWMCGRLGMALVLLAALAILSGAAVWLGAVTQGAHVEAGRLVAAGINAAAPATFLLGCAALVFGIKPRATAAAAYGLLAWSFLVELLGSALNLNHWVLDASIFHHIAAAPATRPDWTSAGALAGLGFAIAALGVALFRRRDLTGD